jgi:DNA polymerase elongation subunit (family B)
MKFYTSFFKHKSNLYIRGYKDKEQFFEIVPLDNCKVYTENPNAKNYTETSIYGTPLEEHVFAKPYEASKFIAENTFRNTWGYPRYDYAKIDELYSGENDTSLIRTCFIDIETFVGNDTDNGLEPENQFPNIWQNCHEISMITSIQNGIIKCQHLSKIDKNEVMKILYEKIKNFDERFKIEFIEYNTEKLLLRDFIKIIKGFSPDIISGWHTNGFDIPYIYARICKVLSPKFFEDLSPFRIITTREYINDFGEKQLAVNIKGIECLDYLDLYRKFELSPRPDHKLETIATIELGVGKLDYSGSFRDFYTNEFNKFIAYNIIDVIRVIEIDREVGFIDVAAQVAYSAKCVFTDVYPVTKIWDNIIANYCRARHIQIPADFNHKKQDYEGAFVKPTIPGKYEFLVTYDVASLN